MGCLPRCALPACCPPEEGVPALGAARRRGDSHSASCLLPSRGERPRPCMALDRGSARNRAQEIREAPPSNRASFGPMTLPPLHAIDLGRSWLPATSRRRRGSDRRSGDGGRPLDRLDSAERMGSHIRRQTRSRQQKQQAPGRKTWGLSTRRQNDEDQRCAARLRACPSALFKAATGGVLPSSASVSCTFKTFSMRS